MLRIGFDSAGDVAIGDVAMRRPLIIVLGAEGKGLRQRVRETCDVVTRLDAAGAINSLNVSNAAAISFYLASAALAQD